MPRILSRKSFYVESDWWAFIKAEMKRQKVTQEDIAFLIGCERSSVSKKFSRRNFTVQECIKIVHLLNIPSEELKRLTY